MIAILGPIEPNAGWDFAGNGAPSDCLRNYAQDVRLKGSMRVKRRFHAGADFWAHRARLPLALSIPL
jgi:hypothetical protein